VAEPLGLDPQRVALGLLQIATASMANAVRSVTTPRGLDPRDFTLIAYGGAGSLRAAGIAAELGIPRVVIPRAPANVGALGMLLADRRQDYVQTLFARLESMEMPELEEAYAKLEQQALRDLGAGDASTEGVRFQRAADMRYGGQEHAVLVPVPACVAGEDARSVIKEAFDATHLERFSHNAPAEPAEVVSLRLEAVLPASKPRFPELASGGAAPPAAATLDPREVTFEAAQGPVACVRYRREGLLAGNVVQGPALIEEPSTVTVVPPSVRVTVHALGHLMLEVAT
jgi:N-methylhydantoinase A